MPGQTSHTVANEAVLGKPAPGLGRYVDNYVGYRQEGRADGLHQGLPSRSLTLVISLADPVRLLRMPDPAAAPDAFTALIAGLHAGPVTLAADELQYGIHVNLTPWAAGALLGHPARVLAGGVYDVRDVLGTRGTELVERVREAPDWPARFAALDAMLGSGLDRGWEPQPEVAQAWAALVRSGGRVPVHNLARDIGWSRRHLGERFRQELGLSPKAAGRVIRFQRSHGALVKAHRAGLAEIAAECGYADQAHLTREWRDLAGQTPTAWMAAELPFVQDNDPHAPQSLAHG